MWGWIVIIFIAWSVFGNPKKDIANRFYPEDKAPWETVDAYFYPNTEDMEKYEIAPKLPDVEACREWAATRAAYHHDEQFERSSYVCCVGEPEDWMGLNIYRTKIK